MLVIDVDDDGLIGLLAAARSASLPSRPLPG
jgi:hypothetical protein